MGCLGHGGFVWIIECLCLGRRFWDYLSQGRECHGSASEKLDTALVTFDGPNLEVLNIEELELGMGPPLEPAP